MGIVDWTLLLLIAACALWGWHKGFTASLIYLGALAFNFYFIGQLYPLLAGTIRSKYHLPPFVSTVISLFFVIILMYVLVKVVIWLMNLVLKTLKLSNINKFLGLLLGLLNGVVIVILLLVILDHAPFLSEGLKNPEKHKVYVKLDSFKDEVLSKLKLTQHEKYLEFKERFKLEKQDDDEGVPIPS